MATRSGPGRRGFIAGGLAVAGVLAAVSWRQGAGRSDASTTGWSAALADSTLGSFPQLAVMRVDGQPDILPSTTQDLRVVNFWARWCGPCRRELPSLQRLAARLDGSGAGGRVRVQTVALEDDAFALREYLRDVKLDTLAVWRLGVDAQPASLALNALPLTFVVAPDGRILARIVGARDWDSDEHVQRLAELALQAPAGG